MTHRGKIQNGVVILNTLGVFAEGAEVMVSLVDADSPVRDSTGFVGQGKKSIHLGRIEGDAVVLDSSESLPEETIVGVEPEEGATYTETGVVKDGIIRLDWPDSIPDGTAVNLEVFGKLLSLDELDSCFKVGDRAVDAGLTDLSSNLDYYLYGHPKISLAPYEIAIGSNGLIEEQSGQLARAWLALEGLSIGDAFGERFFVDPDAAEAMIRKEAAPDPPWSWTDDTLMALSIFESLRVSGEINQRRLARSFSDHYEGSRGYGPAMHRLLAQFREGRDWSEASGLQFCGQGSYGNGGAMRVAPVGAFFADDLEAVAEQAARSAVVTHSHPEAVAGAVAVAIGAAQAWRLNRQGRTPDVREFLDLILPHVPDSIVRERIYHARALNPDASIRLGVAALGNGTELSAQDTVPFALWCAGRHLSDFEAALWWTVGGLGDRDTTCAIVGGIVALFVGEAGLSRYWRGYREPLPTWAFGSEG